jgi:hypothetical protein
MVREELEMSRVRLSPEIQEKVRRVAALKGLTISEVHRLALEQYCERELVTARPGRYDNIIGVAEGPSDLAACASERFADLLAEKPGG